MASEGNNLWPVLKPAPLPKTAKYEYAMWFALSNIIGTTEEMDNGNTKETTRSKVKSWFRDNTPNVPLGSSGDLLVVPILMNQHDLDKHFAADKETGEYLSDVQEPSGGREAWLKERYDEQQHKPRKIREVSGYATKMPGSYATSGGFGFVGAVPSIWAFGGEGL